MTQKPAPSLPGALEHREEILERLSRARPVIFLDYDGTLTPIVDDPDRAELPERTRQLVERLAERWPVVVMSGRALEDVRAKVGLEGLLYAGSHGFNLGGPQTDEQPGASYRPALDRAEQELDQALQGLEGARLERKPFAIAVHYRGAPDREAESIEEQVDAVAARHDELVKTGGKKIFELRPAADWDKGRALEHILRRLHIDPTRALPLYIGDDLTDEDAFRAVEGRGIGILVGGGERHTAADYLLAGPDQVAELLESLAGLAERRPAEDVWSLVYTSYEPGEEKLREALCTTGNGYFATRGAAPEAAAGEAHYPGTYLAGVYNRLKSRVAGRVLVNENMVNAPNWLPLSFRLEGGDWFDLQSVEILDYRQELDLRQGVLKRSLRFQDGRGRRTRLDQRRLTSMRQAHLASLETVLTAENWSGRVEVSSALDGRVENCLVERYQDLASHHLDQRGQGQADPETVWLEVETVQSGVRIALAARTRLWVEGRPAPGSPRLVKERGYVGQRLEASLERGQRLAVEKTAAVYTSRDPAISSPLAAAREELRHAGGFAELLEDHALAWSHLWDRWQLRTESPKRCMEQVLNLHIFHLLQTVSPHTVDLDAGVPPRGLHGEAYRGLIMWDELFIFPLINLRMPDITRGLQMYRYRRLPKARRRARKAGRQGALFPWQSGSDGSEMAQTLHLNPQSGRWIPDNSQLQRHINLAVAYNAWQYYQVTADQDFLSFYGAELMIGVARYWADKAEYDPRRKRYLIRKVMGPDEFHDGYPDSSEPGVDNNAYTNVMAAWLFWRVLELLDLLPSDRRRYLGEDLGLSQEELDHWDRLSRRLLVPFHGEGIISQFEGYGELAEFDWEAYRRKYGNLQRLDRILEAEGDSPNRYKLSKQADVLMLFYLLSADELGQLFQRLGYPFEYRTIPDNVEYYLERTTHGSTLSRVVHSWVLSRSRRETSWHLFQEALQSDIEDIQGGTTSEGIHLGAMAGTVDLMLRCYTGIECREDVLWFNPSLPEEISSLGFGLRYRDHHIGVEITADKLRLESRPAAAAPVRVGLAGRTWQLAAGQSRELEL
jgi:trehalose-phosphatase